MPRYVSIDAELVSVEWYAVLSAMRRAGVAFRVNEGHRTMARQWYFWNLYQSGRGNLAAYPSAWAPHIRTGRIDHAIDFWNDAAVFSWLSSRSLRPARTVRGESWHIEVPAAELSDYAHGHTKPDPLRKLGKRQRAAAERLLYHRREAAREVKSGKGPRYRRHVRYRSFWRKRVVKLHRRAGGERKAVLGRVLHS